MADFVEYKCVYCDKVFATQVKLLDHQMKKQKDKYIGCKVNHDRKVRKLGASSSTSKAASLVSSELRWEGDDLLTPSEASDLAEYNVLLDESDEASTFRGYEVRAGRASVPLVKDDLKRTCQDMKAAMARTVSGSIVHGSSENRVVLPTFSHLYGEVCQVVDNILSHGDFDSITDRSKVVQIRSRRDSWFQMIAVDVSQNNAIIKHKCNPSECSDQCTFAKRRSLFYVQQVFFSLQVAASKKAFTDAWVESAASHLRRLKVEKPRIHSMILTLALNLFGEALGQKLDQLKPETDCVPEPAPVPAPVVAPKPILVPGLEVAQKTLAKGAKR